MTLPKRIDGESGEIYDILIDTQVHLSFPRAVLLRGGRVNDPPLQY